MIIHASAPGYLLEIGGWTDLPFAEHGAALACAIDASARVEIQPYDGRGVVLFPEPETGERSPAEHALVRALARDFQVEGVTVRIGCDVPRTWSLGMPAAVAVAVTGALAVYAGKALTPLQVAMTAHRLQEEVTGQASGTAGYLVSALGGVCHLRIEPYPRTVALPLTLSPEITTELERHLLVVATTRPPVSGLLPQLAARYDAGERLVRDILWQLRALPIRTTDALARQDMTSLGLLMTMQDTLQQCLCPALATPEYCHINELAEQHLCYGIKGNGANGSLTLLCPMSARADLEASLQAADYPVHPVTIDTQGLRVRKSETVRTTNVLAA